ncbi:MAG: hypothetical protein DI533_00370 [Cereibacter sphaeroides]|uniref:Uncharacterized protein n=1 Tax=Cereibacter sphaeroides TaxID=1063 RepID=A0A2W5TTB7_CERSP|nr:MAG: hypothetical protein DI533_00370 [Cereibacter sphaeroides]
MTIIVVRDGVMAVDSRVSDGGTVVGSALKWRAVSEDLGGGYIAGSGDLGKVERNFATFLSGEGELLDGVALVWLKPDGAVMEFDGGWYQTQAPFLAYGSGRHVALGALMMGADAVRAVEIACEAMPGSCGGKIHRLLS